MEKIKAIGGMIASFYFFISFLFGLYFYEQSTAQCIEEHGLFKGLVVGCDVIEGNFGPASPPNHITSQLKGLLWPYHLFFTSTEQPKDIAKDAGRYPFGISVEDQMKAASTSIEMLDQAKVAARCSIVLNVNAEAVRQHNHELYDKMTESSKQLLALARSMTLVHLMTVEDWLNNASPIYSNRAEQAVDVQVSKLLARYRAPFDMIIEKLENGEQPAFNETAKKLYRSDIKTCIGFSQHDYGLPSFEKILERITTPET